MKNQYKFYLSVFFIVFTYSHILNAQPGWFQINPPSPTASYSGIYFPNESTGLVLRYKTTNGGINWTDVGGGSGFIMFFPSLNTGYSTSGGIYKTTNLGTNWISQTNPSGANLYGLYFLNDITGFASGDGASVIRTTNGGSNWIIIPTGISSNYDLHGLFFFNENTGFACGTDFSNNFTGIIIKTTNGGNNWATLTTLTNAGYDKIYFVNNNTGVVVGGSLAQTTDGGDTWIPKNDPLGGYYLHLSFPSQSTGYAIGYYGKIIKTTNSGNTWFGQTSGTANSLKSIYFINNNTGFICGEDGTLLKTTDGGGPPIGIQQINSEVPKVYSISQNYPNPFNPSTNIEFRITKAGFITIKIYNITGNEIEVLVRTNLQPGTYKVDWNALNFPSGVYFYKIITSDYTESKKMVLAK